VYPSAESPAKPRPGLAEALAVWALFGAVALAVLVTYSWLPADERYHYSVGGLAGGAGRALVFLAFPTALVAVPIALLAAAELRTVWARILAGLAVLCCLTVLWPGAVDENDLDPKPINAVTAAGVIIAFGLTIAAWRRDGAQGWGRVAGDRIRVAVSAMLLVGSIPWILAELGVYVDDIPLLGLPFTSDEPSPTGMGPNAVHLGHHHGWDGTILALSALLLTRPLQRLPRSGLRELLAVYLSILLVYGLGNAAQDFWLEQFVKRGWLDWEIPTMLRPEIEPVWGVILVLGLAAYAAFWRTPSSRSSASARS
jgi:hypothetical protein